MKLASDAELAETEARRIAVTVARSSLMSCASVDRPRSMCCLTWSTAATRARQQPDPVLRYKARLTVDVQAQHAARPDLGHLLQLVMNARLRIAQIDVGPIVHAGIEAESLDEELSQALYVWRAEQTGLLDVAPDLQEDGEGVLGFGRRRR